MPLLSIILPVYNGAPFLQRAVESVINQTLQSWELILVNDGSTDNTESICKEYLQKEKRIHYISQDNRGLSAARNAGFSVSSGEYVMYLDADDFVEPSYYEYVTKAVQHTNADFVVTGFTRDFFRCQKRTRTIKTNWNSHILNDVNAIRTASIQPYFYNVYIHVWNKIYRRTTLLKHQIQFDESLCYGEDVPFNIALLTISKNILFLDNVGYHYICHEAERLTTHWNCKLIEYNQQIYKQIAKHEKNCWNVRMPVIAAGMYLRSCFLSCEKAIDNGFSYSIVRRAILKILSLEETKEACRELSLYHQNLEFILYKKILNLGCPLIIYIAVFLRRQFKKCVGR